MQFSKIRTSQLNQIKKRRIFDDSQELEHLPLQMKQIIDEMAHYLAKEHKTI